ncbi:hypothetical protein [Haladaptatus halobius]|uniref:hypothetical protein n=1 Tax=Haladaptatus halobius TaxID=2884875 RepID=UPI001D0B114D|nr:hypothetical protein [Haladaptatus halobius]
MLSTPTCPDDISRRVPDSEGGGSRTGPPHLLAERPVVTKNGTNPAATLADSFTEPETADDTDGVVYS